MRIVFFIQDITTQGGTERTTCCLADEMVRNGQEVRIVSVFRTQEEVQYPLSKSVQVSYLCSDEYDGKMPMTKRLHITARQVRKVKQCIALQEADVIISQKFLASLLLFRAGFAGKSIACEHFRYGMYSSAIRYLRNRVYRHFRCLVVLTETDRQQFLLHGVQQVKVIANMVSIRPNTWQGQNAHRALAVGRLTKQKGFDLLLSAVASIQEQLGNWKIDIYGDGPEQQALLQQRDELKLQQRVHFHPFTQDIEQVYATHAFYIMSSRFEGFPMVLLEAAAAGLPIVSFDCKEGPSVLLQNGGGILVPFADVEQLGEAIARVANDDSLRDTLRQQTHNIVVNYTPETIYTKWMNVLHGK